MHIENGNQTETKHALSFCLIPFSQWYVRVNDFTHSVFLYFNSSVSVYFLMFIFIKLVL